MQGSKGLPIFVGAMAFAVKAVIDKVQAGAGADEGDTFIFNDPYAGGTAPQRLPPRAPADERGPHFRLAGVGRPLAGHRRQRAGGYNPQATECFRKAC